MGSLTTANLEPAAANAVEMIKRNTHAAYGADLLKIVLFGSRARGDAGPDSDIDLAVVLRGIRDRAAERDRLADIAYYAIVETSVDVQALVVSEDEWEHPELHRNPNLIRAIQRDGFVVYGEPSLP
jgi:uncharacterized protein